MVSPVFTPFINEFPISVMARGMLERVLNPEQLDEWFDITAKEQYTKELLFSTIFDLMCQVVQGANQLFTRPSRPRKRISLFQSIRFITN